MSGQKLAVTIQPGGGGAMQQSMGSTASDGGSGGEDSSFLVIIIAAAVGVVLLLTVTGACWYFSRAGSERVGVAAKKVQLQGIGVIGDGLPKGTLAPAKNSRVEREPRPKAHRAADGKAGKIPGKAGKKANAR